MLLVTLFASSMASAAVITYTGTIRNEPVTVSFELNLPTVVHSSVARRDADGTDFSFHDWLIELSATMGTWSGHFRSETGSTPLSIGSSSISEVEPTQVLASQYAFVSNALLEIKLPSGESLEIDQLTSEQPNDPSLCQAYKDNPSLSMGAHADEGEASRKRAAACMLASTGNFPTVSVDSKNEITSLGLTDSLQAQWEIDQGSNVVETGTVQFNKN